MDINEIDALKKMSAGEFRVWLAGKFEVVEMRLSGLEKKRWPWMLAGGGVAGAGGAVMAILRALSIV